MLLLRDMAYTWFMPDYATLNTDQQTSVHFKNTAVWSTEKTQITRCEKSKFYLELAKIQIKKSR